ncbi:MAG TPA: transporter substrate-binding domain-containing protein [Acidisoma sp.]|nr:transporter substrate-binding domain-containing protein [Acidisoma sp.]
MNINRLLGFALAAVLALPAAVSTLTPPAVAAEKLHVTIATEGAFAPWNLTRPDGTLAGFEVDLAKDLCRRMAADCKLVAQNWDGIIPGLLAGKYDAIMSGMSATPKRAEIVAFSAPYGSTGQTFAVMAGGPLSNLPMTGKMISLTADPDAAKQDIAALKPLFKGKTIGVQVSSIAERFIKANFGDVAEIREYATTQEEDLDLVAGRIDAAMASPAYIMTSMKDPANKGMEMAGPRFQGGMLGKGSAVAFRKQDVALRQAFDKALAAAKADGTTKRLSDKWFGYDVTVY